MPRSQPSGSRRTVMVNGRPSSVPARNTAERRPGRTRLPPALISPKKVPRSTQVAAADRVRVVLRSFGQMSGHGGIGAVDGVEPEMRGEPVTLVPFAVVREGPVEVATDVPAVADGGEQLGEVRDQESAAMVVPGLRDAVLGDQYGKCVCEMKPAGEFSQPRSFSSWCTWSLSARLLRKRPRLAGCGPTRRSSGSC
jgi:hypothetical protein